MNFMITPFQVPSHFVLTCSDTLLENCLDIPRSHTMAPNSQSNNTILPVHLMHKNRLQEYTQKLALPHPIYQTINEGFQHAPKFRSSVLVDGSSYTSNPTFLHRKAAEQEVAKYALECISMKASTEACSPAVNLQIRDPLVCKSILHEFAFKSNREVPTYKTICKGGTTTSPVYVSSLVIDGKTYTSEVSGSKKMAEQMAAHTAIRALLGSNSGNLLHAIVKSKEKLGSPSVSAKELSITESLLPIAFQPGTPSHQQQNILVQSPSPKRILPIAYQPENSSRKLSNLPQPITNFNSDNRAIGPHMEGRCRLEIRHFEPMKICNPCDSMMSPNTKEKCVTEMKNDELNKRIVNSFAANTRPNPRQRTSDADQNVESTKRSNSCARMTGTNTEGKRISTGPQNVESNRRFNSCAAMTGPNAEGKRISGLQNVEYSNRRFNSCARVSTCPSAEGKRISGPQNHVESEKRFNSCTRLTSSSAEGRKRIIEAQNMDSEKRFNSLGILVDPNMEGKPRPKIRKFDQSKKMPSIRN